MGEFSEIGERLVKKWGSILDELDVYSDPPKMKLEDYIFKPNHLDGINVGDILVQDYTQEIGIVTKVIHETGVSIASHVQVDTGGAKLLQWPTSAVSFASPTQIAQWRMQNER